jgi:hypothetical protein
MDFGHRIDAWAPSSNSKIIGRALNLDHLSQSGVQTSAFFLYKHFVNTLICAKLGECGVRGSHYTLRMDIRTRIEGNTNG